MLKVSMGTCKKPSFDKPEDLVGGCGNFYWLLDGATPPMSGLNHERTCLFVNELGKELANAVELSRTTNELLYNALKQMCAKKSMFEDNGYCPYSTAIVLRHTANSVEFSVLGDSTLAISCFGFTTSYTDNRLKKIAVKERQAVRELRAKGVDEQGAEYLAARAKLIEAERKFQNVDGGYWVASCNPDAVEHAYSSVALLDDVEDYTIMAVSDGLERLVSVFKRYGSVCDVADAIVRQGKDAVFAELRSLESDRKNFIKPVSCQHDDASFVLITNKTCFG